MLSHLVVRGADLPVGLVDPKLQRGKVEQPGAMERRTE